MTKEQAFNIVAEIVFRRATSFIIEGNPAFESEKVLVHLETTMHEWGYSSPKVTEYCNLLKQENDHLRSMGLNNA